MAFSISLSIMISIDKLVNARQVKLSVPNYAYDYQNIQIFVTMGTSLLVLRARGLYSVYPQRCHDIYGKIKDECLQSRNLHDLFPWIRQMLLQSGHQI